jgi:excisionase family DNA binding protein
MQLVQEWVDVSDESRVFLVTPDDLPCLPEGAQGRLTLKQAAGEFGVHENTIRKWIDKGLLQATRLPSGQRRLDAAGLTQLKSGIAGNLAPALEIQPDALPAGFIPVQVDPTF